MEKKKNANIKDEARKLIGNTMTAVGSTLMFMGTGKVLPVRHKGHYHHRNNYHGNVMK